MFNLEQSIAVWRRQMLTAGIKNPVPLEELESHLREEIERQIKSGMDAQQAFEMSVSEIGQTGALRCEFKKVESKTSKRVGIFAILIGLGLIIRVLVRHHEMGPRWHGDQLGWILFSLIVIFFGLGIALFNFTLGDSREVRLWKLMGIGYSLFVFWIGMLAISSLLIVPKLSAAFGMADRIAAFTAMVASILSIFGWQFFGKNLPVIRKRSARTVFGIAGCLSGPVGISLFFWFILPYRGNFPAPLFFVLLTWMWAAIAVLGGVGYGLAEAANRQIKAT
jgi:hypothetical protein